MYETTEGRYAEVAREMMETGNFLAPTLDYQPHWTKPPLTYWAIAGGLAMFGNNAWGARFFNIIAFLGAVAAVWSIGRIMAGPFVATIAALIYLSSLLPVLGAFTVSTDTLLTLWELLAVMAYLRVYTDPTGKNAGKWIAGMWFFFGLGFFTKGPPALFPLLAIGVWQILHPGRVRMINYYGIGLFGVAAFAWISWAMWKHPHLFSYYLGREIADRLSSSSLHNSEWYKPVTLYLPTLVFAGGPWLIMGMYHFYKKQYPVRIQAVKDFLKSDQPVAFAVYWVLVPLLLFSIVKSRLVLYMLPLYAPLALLTAFVLAREPVDRNRLLKSTARLASVLVVLLIGVKAVSAYYPTERNMAQLLADGRNISPDARIHLYQKKELYGMQFYTSNRMQRITKDGKEPWADNAITTLIARFKKQGSHQPFLILTRKRNFLELQKILTDSGLNWRLFDRGHWQWVLVQRSA